MTKQKIQIKESDLRETLEKALKLAEGHPGNLTSGWGYPVYANEDGSLHIGGMISDNSWQPDEVEVVRVKNWNVTDHEEEDFSEDFTREDAVDFYVNDILIDHYIVKVESYLEDMEADAAWNGGTGCEFEII